jgi:hypothetical protein
MEMITVIIEFISGILILSLGVIIRIRNEEGTIIPKLFSNSLFMFSADVITVGIGLLSVTSYDLLLSISKVFLGLAIYYLYRITLEINHQRSLGISLLLYSGPVLYIIDGISTLIFPVYLKSIHSLHILTISHSSLAVYINDVVSILLFLMVIASFLVLSFKFRGESTIREKTLFIALGLFVAVLLELLPSFVHNNIFIDVIGSLGNFFGLLIVSIKLIPQKNDISQPGQNML